ncbi:L,D-transpeptidase [Rhizobium sp. C1]|uniref:L,D-transpeptidase n=1 Tax=Rhizobium sp. C1 TaxID=1349799 RepID=UPI001E46BA3C|nr:L,D-transpeptidase [Rhizobium sp. C1]MCD2178557.1 L,D-transpeptidase [Rhizobium sp. C1]
MRPRNQTKILGIFAALAISGFASASLAAPTEAGSPVPDAYGKIIDNGFQLPAIPIQKLDKKFHRQIVDFQTKESPGTVIVNTRERFLYYVLSGGKAVRYGIGVGKQGFAWSGTAYVAWKQEWPTWHPPKEMASRKPEVAKYVEDGMNPGVTNPLGARAMYLFNEKGQDTLFRLHGTPEWSSIGTAASSGCIRLINQDVIDLYSRVRPGRNTKVVVIQ